MTTLHHGWLPRNDALGWTINGYAVSPDTKTRKEEYQFVLEEVRAFVGTSGASLRILDAATGYVPTWHLMPYILAADGHTVVTVDFDTRTLTMPPHASIERHLGDLTNLPLFDDEEFDVVCCVSAVEHMSPESRKLALAELLRVAKHKLVLTADLASWLALEVFDAIADSQVSIRLTHDPHMVHLNPRVYFAVVDK